MNVLIRYKVDEADSDWMSSYTLENEEHQIKITKKEDVINFLNSLSDVQINKEVMKELEEDQDFPLDESLDKLYVDRTDIRYVSTTSRLIIKAI